MIASPRTTLRRYALAIVTSAAALLGALALRPHGGGYLSPLFLFYAAVAVSSWAGGFGPGLLATLLGALSATYFLLSPHYRFAVGAPDERGRLVLFVCVGALIAFLTDRLRRNEARARALTASNLIGVFFSDLDGRLEPHCCNSEFLRLTGRNASQVASGRVNWRDMTAPEHRHLDERALEELRRCRFCTPFEKEYVIDEGARRVPVLMGCAMLDGSDDRVVGFVLDLTERRLAEVAAREHEERVRAMSAELMLAEERERRRIATVLHDAVGQTLALAKLKVESMREQQLSQQAGNGLPARLAEVYGLIDYAVQHTRTLTNELSPPVLYELGLEAALQWLADRAREQHGLTADFEDDGQPKPIGPEVRTVLFQAVRELLVNIAKHARATRCQVAIRRAGNDIQIRVEDDGSGFDPAAAVSTTRGEGTGGFGLFNVRERITRLGGRVRIDSQPAEGTRVTLVVPLASVPLAAHSAAAAGPPAAGSPNADLASVDS
jgi:signal transduction histidine kinase